MDLFTAYPLDNRRIVGSLSLNLASMRFGASRPVGRSWPSVRSNSKAQKRKAATARGKARKVAKAVKRTVAKAKPKSAPVKKARRQERMKQPVAPVVETVAAEVIERPAPGVITVTEVEETRQVS
jgi:hypothetical protein